MIFAATGLAEHDVVGAVSQRFTGPEITAALAFLQQQGLVNYSGVKRPLMLSKLFTEHMEVGCTDALACVSYAQPALILPSDNMSVSCMLVLMARCLCCLSV